MKKDKVFFGKQEVGSKDFFSLTGRCVILKHQVPMFRTMYGSVKKRAICYFFLYVISIFDLANARVRVRTRINCLQTALMLLLGFVLI